MDAADGSIATCPPVTLIFDEIASNAAASTFFDAPGVTFSKLSPGFLMMTVGP